MAAPAGNAVKLADDIAAPNRAKLNRVAPN
jgi:hypothetical protein